MKPNKHTQREKKYRAIINEEHDLFQYRLGEPKELDEPYQRGWTKSYILRDDVSRRSDARIIEKLIRKFSRSVYSRDGSFRGYYRKSYVVLNPEISTLSEREYFKLSEQERSYFHKYNHYLWGGDPITRYRFTHTWMLDTKIEPYMITHTRIPYGDVETRRHELSTFILINSVWSKLAKRSDRWNPRHYRNIAKQKALQEEIYEELDRLNDLSFFSLNTYFEWYNIFV